ncbi:MAG: hypothetical protein CVV61_00590 [Tenericutes bacterium HGW-Tenericutes-6]|nr:MAG: hypothetical protein CVV61_00590 [Tenericutes bacterium HGW-Tenericutes-6]
MDSKYSKELAMFFDTIRYQRGLTQIDFIDGIVSIRQYRRYLSGESKMTQDVINQFSRKLSFKPEHVILDFEASRINEGKLVVQFYNAVVNYDKEKEKTLGNMIKATEIIDPYHKVFLAYTYELQNLYHKKNDEKTFLENALKIIDYPNILKIDLLSAVEILILASLITVPLFDGKDQVATRIKILMENPNLMISGDNNRVLFACMVKLSTYYGINKRFQDVIDICLLGVKNSHEQNSYYLLDYFYYNLSLAYHYLNNEKERDYYIYRLFMTLEMSDNKAKFKKFKDLVEDDYKIHFESFIHEYMKKYKFIKK